jgi:hypothetical protein
MVLPGVNEAVDDGVGNSAVADSAVLMLLVGVVAIGCSRVLRSESENDG